MNKHLATDIYPLPRLEELVDQAAGHNFYATLDMREPNFQIILKNYLDDLIIWAPDLSSLTQRLRKTFTLFKEDGVKLYLSKCEIAKKEVTFRL